MQGNILFAKHIVGGDFTYRRLPGPGNFFELSLKLFRDCNSNVDLDNTILIGVFDKVTNLRIDTLTMSLINTSPLVVTGSSCLTPPEVCVDRGLYIDTISLPNNPNGYYISWERCCRNALISNLTQPNNTGIAFYMEMPNPAMINSSPYFVNDPFPFMCVGQNFEYDFSAVDVNGDQLVYELVTPLAGDLGYPVTSFPNAVWSTPTAGPYMPAQWLPGYSLANVCNSTVPLAINPSTGLLTMTSSSLGFYAMAIVIHEFRGGVEIGQIRREIEFTVISCDGNSPPQLSFSNSTFAPSGLTFTIYESDTLCFTLGASDPDTITLTYNGDVFPGSGITPPFASATTSVASGYASSSFCWYTTCNHGRTAPYHVNYFAQDNGCPISYTTTNNVLIYVLPMPQIPPPVMVCMDLDSTGVIKINYVDTLSLPRFLGRYIVYKGIDNTGFAAYDTIYNAGINNYVDNNALYNDSINYCYFFIPFNKCGEQGIISDTIRSAEQLTVFPVPILSTLISEPDARFDYTKFADNPYSVFYIERRLNDYGNTYSLYTTVNNPLESFFDDESVDVDHESYCYRITKQNLCGNISVKSNEACTILLTGESFPGQNILSWTAYREWDAGVKHYNILRRPKGDGPFAPLVTVPDSILNFIDTQFDELSGIFEYMVKAVEDSVGYESISNIIELQQQATLFVPSAFTPNDDGTNETWLPVTFFVKEMHVMVFNRWGMLVFETDDKTLAWDGNYKGDKAQQGTYYYVLKYTNFIDATEEVKKGSVTLVR